MKRLLTAFLLLLVRGYQLLISPLLGPSCRFYPSCSQYTLEAIELHGPVRGLWLGIKRISRCHPGCEGGIDPVPGTETHYPSEEQTEQSAQIADLEDPHKCSQR